MRLIIHQALKDVRLLRWPIAAWVAVLAAFHGVILYTSGRTQPNVELSHTLGTIQTLLCLAGSAGFIVVAALLVQHDSPATTTTFWVTRPISRGTMLASKLLTAFAILCALPVAFQFVDLAAAGLDPRAFPLTQALYDLAWLLSLMALASVTVGLPQFTLVAIIEFLLVALMTAAALTWAPRGITRYNFGILNHSAWPLVGFSLALLAHQYLTRRTRRSAVALATAPLILAGLVALIAYAGAETEAATHPALRSIAITVDPNRIGVAERGENCSLDVPLTISGVPDDTSVSITARGAWLQVGPQRIDLAAGAVGTWRSLASADETAREVTRVFRQALRGAALLNPESGPRVRDHVTLLSRTADVRSASATPATLHIEIDLQPWVYRPFARVPLRAGSTFRTLSMSGKVLDAPAAPGPPVIMLRETEVYWGARWFAFSRYVARNARLNEAVLLSDTGAGAFTAASTLMTAFFPVNDILSTQWRQLGIDQRRLSPPAPNSAWFGGAELVAVRVEVGDSVRKAIEVPFGAADR